MTTSTESALMRRCEFCPVEFEPKRVDQKCCGSAACRKAQKQRNNRERERRIFAETGEWRGRSVERANPAIVEKNRARLRAANAEMPFRKRYPASAAARDARRRLREHPPVDVEAFTKHDVGERDGWVCGLCAEPVDPTLEAWVNGTWVQELRSASIDHVLPISRGGEHTLGNVQIAHLGCNIAKNDRVEAAVA